MGFQSHVEHQPFVPTLWAFKANEIVEVINAACEELAFLQGQCMVAFIILTEALKNFNIFFWHSQKYADIL